MAKLKRNSELTARDETISAYPVEVDRLSFRYADAARPSLSGLGFSLEAGTLTVLIGASGCGKTTLCKCMVGVIPRLIKGTIEGEIRIFGREIANDKSLKIGGLAQQIGFVMQEPDHQIVMTTAEDDVAFGPENLMLPPADIRRTVDAVLEDMNLTAKSGTDPAQLSGGEKQRLAACGILALGPDIMVFDEPVSNLDAAGKAHFAELIRTLREMKKTLIIVEHDFGIFDFADRWILMKNGRIIADDVPKRIPAHILERELWL